MNKEEVVERLEEMAAMLPLVKNKKKQEIAFMLGFKTQYLPYVRDTWLSFNSNAEKQRFYHERVDEAVVDRAIEAHGWVKQLVKMRKGNHHAHAVLYPLIIDHLRGASFGWFEQYFKERYGLELKKTTLHRWFHKAMDDIVEIANE